MLDLLGVVLRPRFLSLVRLLVLVEVLPLQDSHPSLEPPVLLELLALEDEAAPLLDSLASSLRPRVSLVHQASLARLDSLLAVLLLASSPLLDDKEAI